MCRSVQRALVVVDSTEESKEVVREAGELAAGVGAGLVLLHVTTEEEYEKRREKLAAIASNADSLGVTRAREGARQFAENVGNEVLSDVDAAFESVGSIGEKKDEILSVADEEDCDYVFLLGRKRSPTGKALFGDDTQSVILNFEGSTVVRTV